MNDFNFKESLKGAMLFSCGILIVALVLQKLGISTWNTHRYASSWRGLFVEFIDIFPVAFFSGVAYFVYQYIKQFFK